MKGFLREILHVRASRPYPLQIAQQRRLLGQELALKPIIERCSHLQRKTSALRHAIQQRAPTKPPTDIIFRKGSGFFRSRASS